MTTENTEARKYELMLVLKADQGDEAITKYVDEIKKFITDLGGDIFFEDVWGRRELAYKIKKEDTGYYVVFNFTIDGEKLKELNDHLRIEQMILRSLLSKTPEGYEPTPITEADLEWSKRARKDDEEEEEKEEKEEKKPAKKTKEVKKEEIEEEVEEAPEEEPEEEEIPEEEEPETEEAPEEEVEEAEEKIEEEEKTPKEEEEPETEEEQEEEETAEEEEPEEAPEEKPKKEDEKKTMDDLDEKLKAIMNDTDLDISL